MEVVVVIALVLAAFAAGFGAGWSVRARRAFARAAETADKTQVGVQGEDRSKFVLCVFCSPDGDREDQKRFRKESAGAELLWKGRVYKFVKTAGELRLYRREK